MVAVNNKMSLLVIYHKNNTATFNKLLFDNGSDKALPEYNYNKWMSEKRYEALH